MEAIISRLVAQFESGEIDRRQLIHGLAAAAAAALIPARASAQPRRLPENPYANGFQVVGIDHISMSVNESGEPFFTIPRADVNVEVE